MEKYELLPILLVRLLGKRQATKSDDFLEKFQTPFDPPSSFLENYIAIFSENIWVQKRQF